MHELGQTLVDENLIFVENTVEKTKKKLDKFITDYLKDRAKEIGTTGINLMFIEYTLGLKEKTLAEKFEEYIFGILKDSAKEDSIKHANTLIQISEDHHEKT